MVQASANASKYSNRSADESSNSSESSSKSMSLSSDEKLDLALETLRNTPKTPKLKALRNYSYKLKKRERTAKRLQVERKNSQTKPKGSVYSHSKGSAAHKEQKLSQFAELRNPSPAIAQDSEETPKIDGFNP